MAGPILTQHDAPMILGMSPHGNQWDVWAHYHDVLPRPMHNTAIEEELGPRLFELAKDKLPNAGNIRKEQSTIFAREPYEYLTVAAPYLAHKGSMDVFGVTVRVTPKESLDERIMQGNVYAEDLIEANYSMIVCDVLRWYTVRLTLSPDFYNHIISVLERYGELRKSDIALIEESLFYKTPLASLEVFLFTKDVVICKRITSAMKMFRERYLLQQKMPPADSSDVCEQVVALCHPRGRPIARVCPERLRHHLVKIYALETQKKRVENAYRRQRNILKIIMGDIEMLHEGDLNKDSDKHGRCVYWKTNEQGVRVFWLDRAKMPRKRKTFAKKLRQKKEKRDGTK